MSQKTNDRISPANILALIGIAGIGVISFIGALLNTEDATFTWPIIWALIVMAVLSGLLCLGIFAKAENSHRELWNAVMWSSFVLYFIAAIFMSNPFFKFFFVAGDKANLQAQAIEEIDNMEKTFKSYEEQRKEFLSQARTQLEAFQQNKLNSTPELQQYFRENVGGDIKVWIEDIAIPATDINNIKKTEEWNLLKKEINNWNYFKITQTALRLKNLQNESWLALNKYIEEFGEDQALIPVIEGGLGKPYDLKGNATFDLGEEPVSKFSSTLAQDKDVLTPLGIAAYILLNLLVLFNLLVAPSSKAVNIKNRGINVGGTTL